MPTISTKDYLLDQAKRRLIPTVNNIPGMGALEKRLLAREPRLVPWMSVVSRDAEQIVVDLARSDLEERHA